MKIRLLLAALCALLSLPLFAMDFKTDGDIAVLSGEPDFPDSARIEEAATKGVKTVVFRSLGAGSVMTNQALARAIGGSGLHIVVDGRCSSACAKMVLSAKSRQFALRTKSANYLLIAGTAGKNGPVRISDNYVFFKDRLSSSFPAEVLARHTTDWDGKSSIRFYAPSEKHPEGLVCEFDGSKCIPLAGITSLNAGVITSTELFQLPEALSANELAKASTPE